MLKNVIKAKGVILSEYSKGIILTNAFYRFLISAENGNIDLNMGDFLYCKENYYIFETGIRYNVNPHKDKGYTIVSPDKMDINSARLFFRIKDIQMVSKKELNETTYHIYLEKGKNYVETNDPKGDLFYMVETELYNVSNFR